MLISFKRKLDGVLMVLMVVLVFTLFVIFSKEYKIGKVDCPVNATLERPMEENRKIIRNYPTGDSGPYLPALGLAELDEVTEVYGEPVIITTGSANYVTRLKGWLKNLIKDMRPILKIIIYDIGLTSQQRKQICEHTQCVVKDFPFRKFPAFVKECLPCIAWKPLVIQLALEEFGFVIWMDAAVYVMDGNLAPGIDMARQTGIAIGRETYGGSAVKIAYETVPETFQALGEHACAFDNSYTISASLLFIQKGPYVYKYIMRPWVSCALTQSCISGGRAIQNKCHYSKNFGYCHRFAQSVFGIIINRLYRSNLNTVDLGHEVKWRKCYIGRDHVLIDDMLFVHYLKKDIIQCPDGRIDLR